MMKVRYAVMTALVLQLLFPAQSNGQGIQWTTGINWQQVKDKAKKENKYIFLDVYATWCVPCKEMDKRVYVKDSVGAFFNDKFISVKVQTDQTVNDDDEIKKWYNDAKFVQQENRIRSFPTFLFFSPQGTLVHKSSGLRSVRSFLNVAKKALTPGQVYIDPYAKYDKLVADYRAGKKDYSHMGYMIKSARELRDIKFAEHLTEEYVKYIEHAPRKQLYTKDVMNFLETSDVKSSSKTFSLFYPNGKKADKAAGVKGFSDRMVHRAVLYEIVLPFLGITGERRPVRVDGKPVGQVDTSEADWILLYKKINVKYPDKYAEKGVLNGKIFWYEDKENFPAYYASLFDKLDKYDFDSTGSSNTSYGAINSKCWFLFLGIDDKELISRAVKWMRSLVNRFPQDPAYLDTYANLLYKSGDKENAILWEEKALQWANEFEYERDIEEFAKILKKMKNNEATW
ncbi:MAG: DUF255 domain-containing protein [Chitinophagaceae bacterium]|nr:DUF255 domain-containing protein [Chitinophagaceae bacterium]